MKGGLHREGLVDQLLLVLIVLDGDSGRGGGGHRHVSAPRSPAAALNPDSIKVNPLLNFFPKQIHFLEITSRCLDFF